MQKLCGVYTITNIIDGKVYVGSSVDIKTRWYGHRDKLNRGTHGNKFLLNSWRKYSAAAFEFRIITICLPCDLCVLEQELATRLNAFDHSHGFNLANIMVATRLGKKHSAESIAKMRVSAARRGPRPKMSDATKIKMSLSQQERYRNGKSPNLGRVFPAEWRRKLSESHKGLGKGRIVSQETCDKISRSKQMARYKKTIPHAIA